LCFYLNRFSLCISAAVYSLHQEIEAEAEGHLMQKAKIALTIVPLFANLSALIRVGGRSDRS